MLVCLGVLVVICLVKMCSGLEGVRVIAQSPNGGWPAGQQNEGTGGGAGLPGQQGFAQQQQKYERAV